MSIYETGDPTVDAVGRMNFRGNIIQESWYQHVRYTNKRGNFLDPMACLFLGEIVYWFRPSEIRDESTGYVVGSKKKFSGEKLRRSPEAFADKFGCSIKVARESLALLEKLGLIEIEVKSCKTQHGTLPKVMYIGLNASRLGEINQPKPITPNSGESALYPNGTEGLYAQMGNKQCPNGIEAVPKWDRSSAQMGELSIYRDLIETKEIKREEATKEEKSKSQESGVASSLPDSANPTQDPNPPSSGASPLPQTLPPDPMGDRMRAGATIPCWRVGLGMNQWHPDVVDGVLAMLNSQNLGKKERGDAVSWISKREKPSHPDHEMFVFRAQEWRDAAERKRQQQQELEAARQAPVDLNPYRDQRTQEERDALVAQFQNGFPEAMRLRLQRALERKKAERVSA